MISSGGWQAARAACSITLARSGAPLGDGVGPGQGG